MERFGLQNANAVTTPLEPGAILTKDQCPTTPAELQGMSVQRHRELIGSLQYVELAIRPDISLAISKLAQILVNPTQIYLDAALCVLRYLKGTRRWTLNLGGDIADIGGYTARIGEVTATIGSPLVRTFPWSLTHLQRRYPTHSTSPSRR